MNILIGFLFFTLVLVNGQKPSACCEKYCYEFDNVRPQEEFFSSKTSYFIGKHEDLGKEFQVPNCTPIKIWLYIRHGSRLPKSREMANLSQLEKLRDEIVANYEERNSQPAIGAMCKNDIDLLKTWHWNKNITPEYNEYLTEQGWNEAKILAHRYRNHFPNIFQNNYDESKFLFRYTDVHRTEATFKAFTEGLFGENASEYILTPPMEQSKKMMMPYKFCPTDKGETAGENSEYGKYLKSDIMKKLVSDVSERLGFKTPLELRKVMDMYDMCIYDQSFNLSDSSPWCTAFTPSQIYDLEYPEDLRKYYESGHGREANARFLCELMNDMLGHLGNNEQPKAVTYLSHSSSYLLLLSSLGAFKDSEPLLADNYNRLDNRKWRLSKIARLASNFAAVKYYCPAEAEPRKVKFFINEEPLELDGCDRGMCDWGAVKERYKVYSEVNCDEYYCSKPKKETQPPSGTGSESSANVQSTTSHCLFITAFITLVASSFNGVF